MKPALRYFARVLGYLRPHRRMAGASIALTVIGALAGLLAPWPLKILIDHVLEQHPLPPALAATLGGLAGDRTLLLVLSVLAGLVVAMLINGVSVANNYVNTRIEQQIMMDFRSDLLQHAQRLSLAFHDRKRSGMVIYAINNQGDAPASLIMTIPMLAESLLTLVGMFVISFHMDWKLALLSLAVVPFLYSSVGYYATHIQERLREVRNMEGESLSLVHEGISMMRVIVAFGREEHEHRKFREQTARAVDARVKVTVRQTLFTLAVNMITAVGTALVLGLGAYHVLHDRLTVGQLLVLLAYIAAVYKPLETISYTIGSLQDKFASLQVAYDLLDREPEIRDRPGATPIAPVAGRVTFDRVSFNYAGRADTLKDISFDAPAGHVVGVVGPTGAGKSTLASLIPRFYEPKQGRILVDGVDIRDVTLRSLRSNISLVLQEPLLFSGTIAENIRYGRLDATMEDIVEAAKAANAHDFIQKLPKKYDTILGERGAAVSGGERQRISIARAFLKNAPILILDEPTSSVDSRTEQVILQALERLMAGRTTVMIAHRLSTLNRADLILVLDQGRLVEQGTRDSLLQAGGLFRQLYDAQTQAAKAAPKGTPK